MAGELGSGLGCGWCKVEECTWRGRGRRKGKVVYGKACNQMHAFHKKKLKAQGN